MRVAWLIRFRINISGNDNIWKYLQARAARPMRHLAWEILNLRNNGSCTLYVFDWYI